MCVAIACFSPLLPKRLSSTLMRQFWWQKPLTKSTSCVHQINFTYARECFSLGRNGFFPPRLQHFNTSNTILMSSTFWWEPKSIYKYLIKRHRKSIKDFTAAVYAFKQLQDILNVNVILFRKVSELIHIVRFGMEKVPCSKPCWGDILLLSNLFRH
jgi:hypothetical protein